VFWRNNDANRAAIKAAGGGDEAGVAPLAGVTKNKPKKKFFGCFDY
jgi:hypothetical protein